MAHTIHDLWYGNLAPCDEYGVHAPEINKLLVLMGRAFCDGFSLGARILSEALYDG